MSLIGVILVLTLQGLIIGAFARLALPGKDPLTIPQTIAVGLAGSFIAGLLTFALFDEPAPSFLAALVFSVLILYFIRKRRGGGLVSPGDHDGRN